MVVAEHRSYMNDSLLSRVPYSPKNLVSFRRLKSVYITLFRLIYIVAIHASMNRYAVSFRVIISKESNFQALIIRRSRRLHKIIVDNLKIKEKLKSIGNFWVEI